MAPVTFSPQGRQRLVNRVKRQLAASAAARAGADDDEDADDLIYVPPIAPGQIKLYSYFGKEIGFP
jgi:hypothetical protein